VFSFPKYGGTGAVWQKMSDKLPQEWFNMNSRVTQVDARDRKVTYTDTNTGQKKTIEYDALLNTAPIDQLVKQTGVCPELQLDHNQVSNNACTVFNLQFQVFIVGVGLKLPMPENMDAFTWLYFPDPNVPFYRVTYLSRYGEVTPDNTKYWSVMCECARRPDDTVI
jgi:protoporphyrinogen oxidase